MCIRDRTMSDLVPRSVSDSQTEGLFCHIVSRNVIGRRFGRVTVEYILRKASGQVFWHVTCVMRICARFAAVHGDAGFCVGSLEVTREIKVEDLVANRSTIRCRVRRSYGQNLKWPSPIKR